MAGSRGPNDEFWVLVNPWSGADGEGDPPNELGALTGLALRCAADLTDMPQEVAEAMRESQEGNASWGIWGLTWSLEPVEGHDPIFIVDFHLAA